MQGALFARPCARGPSDTLRFPGSCTLIGQTQSLDCHVTYDIPDYENSARCLSNVLK